MYMQKPPVPGIVLDLRWIKGNSAEFFADFQVKQKFGSLEIVFSNVCSFFKPNVFVLNYFRFVVFRLKNLKLHAA